MGCALLIGAAAQAQPRYGDATVLEGSMLLLRGEQRHEYKSGDPAVVVVFGDVVTVRPRSRVSLLTIENVEITMGGNSVFQAKPFERDGERGMLRVLYGRLHTKVVRLLGERFTMKTAQGVIGVKGTEFFTSVTAQGDTLVAVDETQHVVSLQGLQGPVRELPADVMAVVLNNKSVSTSAIVTPELRTRIATEALEAPAAYTEEARALPAENALLRAGIVTERDLVDAKRERVTLTDVIRGEERAQPLRQRYEITPETAPDVLRPKLLLSPRP